MRKLFKSNNNKTSQRASSSSVERFPRNWFRSVDAQIRLLKENRAMKPARTEEAVGSIPTWSIMKKNDLAKLIDHSILKPGLKRKDISEQLKLVKRLKTQVCVYYKDIKLARKILGKRRLISCVISFPLGADSTKSKIKQAEKAIKAGADEIDMVSNYKILKKGNIKKYENDILKVAEVVKRYGKVLKVIIETSELTKKQKIIAVNIIKEIHQKTKTRMFVKTSTGFASGGATISDIKLIRKILGDNSKIGIKPSGGIRTQKQCENLFKAAGKKARLEEFRIGTSKSEMILKN